jgi:hypothetical protein
MLLIALIGLRETITLISFGGFVMEWYEILAIFACISFIFSNLLVFCILRLNGITKSPDTLGANNELLSIEQTVESKANNLMQDAQC